MSGAFRLVVDNGLARLTFDTPDEKVNKFSAFVVAELDEIIGRLESSRDIQALIFRSGKPDVFVVGADVREIENIADSAEGAAKSAAGQRLFERWSRLPYPTVAAISGVCLGGGLELALACDYRIASDSAKTRLGLPEVQLGIIPGWGGTQRLPRLIGLPVALDLILTGRTIDGRRATKIGLADECVPDPIFGEWSETFARLKFGSTKPRGIRPGLTLPERFLNGTPPGRAVVHARARRSVLAKTGGHYPAPLEALAAAAEGYGKPIEEGLAIENRHFRNLIATPIQKNLLRIFNWTERIKKENGSRDPAVRPREITRAGVLGAGVMGGGIAQLAADRGIPTRMKDIAAEPLRHGFATAAQLWKDSIRRKHRPLREFDAKMAMLSGGLDYSGFAGAEITMEAVVEKLPVKRAVLSEWEAAVPEDRIFASNTSTIPITDIAADARAPRRVIGLHFFNPVHRMPLVEIIVGDKTSEETVVTTFAFARRLGKTPVVVRDAPGFLVNRILAPYISEAVRLLEDGCAVEEIDRVMIAFGMPVGPLALLDDVGIDVASKGGETMARAFPSRLPRSERFGPLLQAGHLGRKTARGFYRYDGTRRDGAEPSIYAELSLPSPRREALPPEVIESRLILPMINEAAFSLEDRIVDSPDKVDLAMIFGTGFPAFRGGLLCHADALGIDRVVHRLEDLADRLGERFAPAPRLVEMHRERRTFYLVS